MTNHILIKSEKNYKIRYFSYLFRNWDFPSLRAGLLYQVEKKFMTSYWFGEYGTSEGPE